MWANCSEKHGNDDRCRRPNPPEAKFEVKHLVQEHLVDHDAIVIGPDDGDNSVGFEPNGADDEGRE